MVKTGVNGVNERRRKGALASFTGETGTLLEKDHEWPTGEQFWRVQFITGPNSGRVEIRCVHNREIISEGCH